MRGAPSGVPRGLWLLSTLVPETACASFGLIRLYPSDPSHRIDLSIELELAERHLKARARIVICVAGAVRRPIKSLTRFARCLRIKQSDQSRQETRTGQRDEARAMLAEIYNWFTEGFDTADLKDAKALREELNR